MKTGETFKMSLYEFAQPMKGRLADVTLQDGEVVRVRVMSIDHEDVKLAVVPKTTKE